MHKYTWLFGQMKHINLCTITNVSAYKWANAGFECNTFNRSFLAAFTPNPALRRKQAGLRSVFVLPHECDWLKSWVMWLVVTAKCRLRRPKSWDRLNFLVAAAAGPQEVSLKMNRKWKNGNPALFLLHLLHSLTWWLLTGDRCNIHCIACCTPIREAVWRKDGFIWRNKQL